MARTAIDATLRFIGLAARPSPRQSRRSRTVCAYRRGPRDRFARRRRQGAAEARAQQTSASARSPNSITGIAAHNFPSSAAVITIEARGSDLTQSAEDDRLLIEAAQADPARFVEVYERYVDPALSPIRSATTGTLRHLSVPTHLRVRFGP